MLTALGPYLAGVRLPGPTATLTHPWDVGTQLLEAGGARTPDAGAPGDAAVAAARARVHVRARGRPRAASAPRSSATALCATYPPLLGHAGLATTDVAAVATVLGFLLALDRWAVRPDARARGRRRRGAGARVAVQADRAASVRGAGRRVARRPADGGRAMAGGRRRACRGSARCSRRRRSRRRRCWSSCGPATASPSGASTTCRRWTTRHARLAAARPARRPAVVAGARAAARPRVLARLPVPARARRPRPPRLPVRPDARARLPQLLPGRPGAEVAAAVPGDGDGGGRRGVRPLRPPRRWAPAAAARRWRPSRRWRSRRSSP